MIKIVSFITGIVAVSCYVYSIQNKEKNKILIFQVLSNVFYAIQYALLNSVSAACVSVISTIRTSLIYVNDRRGKENSIPFLVIFFIIIGLCGYFTYDGLLSLVPIVINLIYTYVMWQNDTRKIRFAVLFCAFLWVFYNFRVGAYVALFGNAIEIVSGVVSIIRFDIKNKVGENN